MLAVADERAQRKIFFGEFQAAELLRAIGILDQQGLEERGRQHVERHDALERADGHHCARTAVLRGRQVELVAMQQMSRERTHRRVPVHTWFHPAQKLARRTLGQDSELGLVSTQIAERAGRAVPRQDRTADDAQRPRRRLVPQQVRRVRAYARSQDPWP